MSNNKDIGQLLTEAVERAEKAERERDVLKRMQKFFVRFAYSCDLKETDECINWSGNTDAKGYGRIHGHGGAIKVHRISYCLHAHCTLSDIEEMVVRHTCDNPLCVNQNHLLAGSDAENVKDRVERKRSACGESSGTSKLTEKQVEDIRAFYKRGVRGRGSESTAQKFGVNHSTVQRIVTGKSWAHTFNRPSSIERGES